ncbi:MAG: hypothetical protein O2887_00890 [Bacteroidetes bacterium]|nr:hypothetical protein [Bacteroidota bacterium]MDA1119045.1 hypothetical protein [Bacteroidota bacterium]
MLLLLALLPFLYPGQSGKFVRVNATNEISLSIPANFILLPDNAVFERHGHYRAPVAFYTDPTGEIDLSISQNVSRWRQEDIEIYKDFYKANILSLYDDAEFSKEEIKDVRGQQFAVFEFISTLREDEKSFRGPTALRKYTYIMYTVYKETTLIYNFTSDAKTKNQWSPVANEIMEGIALK